MNLLQAAGFPFANTDLTKAWVDPRLASALLEAQHKNAAALINANQVVFDGLKTLARRERDLFESTVADYSKVTNDALALVSFEEKASQQADAARHIYESSVARLRELSDIAVKTNVTAIDILNARVTEVFDEFRALFAAAVEPTTTTSAGPPSVIAEPLGVIVEEKVAPVGNAVASVEPTATAEPKTAARTAKSTPKTAAPTAKATPKTAARAAKATSKMPARAAKTARRPTSRS
jgi:phasin family protein